MNTNDRTVVIENVGDCSIGLSDTQRRKYNLQKGAKMRISAVSLQDILDHPGSRTIFREGMVKVSNISRDELYSMGLSEEEIDKYLLEEKRPTIIVKEELESEEEIVLPVEKTEVVEEVKVVAKPKTTTKKPAAKKSTSKKTK
jgi:hypothetical protein